MVKKPMEFYAFLLMVVIVYGAVSIIGHLS